MKSKHVVFFLTSSGLLRFFLPVITELENRGHNVTTVLVGKLRRARHKISAGEVPPNLNVVRIPVPIQKSALALWVEQLLGYIAYLKNKNDDVSYVAQRWISRAPRWTQWLLMHRFFQKLLLRSENVLRFYRQSRVVDDNMKQFILQLQPDVAVGSTYVEMSPEAEYIKACVDLNIPTVYCMASWDNLVTKGTILDDVNRVIVWNEINAQQAHHLHSVPLNRISILGSPYFEQWVQLHSQLDYQQFVEMVGIPAGKTYAVYLCSSGSLGDDEAIYIRDIRATLDIDLHLVVRPHPSAAAQFVTELQDEEGITVYPVGGELTYTADARMMLFHTLHYAVAAIGLNTSAFLEACIVNTPCVTLLTPYAHDRLRRFPHYKQLREGQFIYYADDVSSFKQIMRDLQNGEHIHRQAQQTFIQNFVFPVVGKTPSESIADQLLLEART